MNRFSYYPIATFLDDKGIESVAGKYFELLDELMGCKESKQSGTTLPNLYFIISGGTEKKTLELIDEVSDPSEPVLLMAHSGNNSLPASLEILAKLKQEGKRGEIIYFDSHDDASAKIKLTDAIAEYEAYLRLKRKRIGMFGEPSDWLVASMQSGEIVKKAWGPEVIPVEISEAIEMFETIRGNEAKELSDEFRNKADYVKEPSDSELEDTAKVYMILKELIDKYELDTITVRCFDFLPSIKNTGCYALAELNDEGITAGCEGDIVSALGMLWVKELLGKSAWMANPSRIYPERNELELAHCTIPLGMTDGYGIRSHFESNLGIGIAGKLKKEPVTLLRIGGKDLKQIWLAEGEIIESGCRENLCRTQATVKLDDTENISELLENPLGNHTILIEGRNKEYLLKWWKKFIDK